MTHDADEYAASAVAAMHQDTGDNGLNAQLEQMTSDQRYNHFYAAGEHMLVGAEPQTFGREGLVETPKRFAKSWMFQTSGYDKNAADILKVFEDGAEGYDEMVNVVDIPFYSNCEHHLETIIGRATVAYIPDGKVAGLSKLNRLVDMYARRLQIQERLTVQIADALQEHLQPLGIGVYVRARHMCMEARGVSQTGHFTTTTALRGAMKDQPATRAEFLALARTNTPI